MTRASLHIQFRVFSNITLYDTVAKGPCLHKRETILDILDCNHMLPDNVLVKPKPITLYYHTVQVHDLIATYCKILLTWLFSNHVIKINNPIIKLTAYERKGEVSCCPQCHWGRP